MKPTLPILLALLALPAGYWATLHVLPEPVVRSGEHAGLEWLRREFELADAALVAVERLQADYAPICAGHCAAIAAAEHRLQQATQDERAAAEAELARLHEVCATATRAHLQAIAACMSPAQGRRFLRMMESRVAHQPGRTNAPALDGPP